mgnify:CR=1 FL=1
MKQQEFTSTLKKFEEYLLKEERERGTIDKYLRDLKGFLSWLNGVKISKMSAIAWKQSLVSAQYAPATINSMLASVNKYFAYLGRQECRIKYLRVQRKLFRDTTKELTKEEYMRLLEAAHNLGRERLSLLIESICATGIRVSEVKYITVEAAGKGYAEVFLKGKIRTILLPGKLCRKLLKYAKRQKITSGELFLTRSGKGISRRQIWSEMKTLCKAANVIPSKVFPHNLRHLFAKIFYGICRDIVKLADVLGHSSIETTRIYLVSTGIEYSQQLEGLGLIH